MLAELEWNTGTLAVVLIFGPGLAAVIGHYWHKVVKTAAENDLKRSMVERGMSVEEIERVLAARSSRPADSLGGSGGERRSAQPLP